MTIGFPPLDALWNVTTGVVDGTGKAIGYGLKQGAEVVDGAGKALGQGLATAGATLREAALATGRALAEQDRTNAQFVPKDHDFQRDAEGRPFVDRFESARKNVVEGVGQLAEAAVWPIATPLIGALAPLTALDESVDAAMKLSIAAGDIVLWALEGNSPDRR
jgi:hypothetical protein